MVTANPDDSEAPAPRRARESISEMAGMSVATICITIGLAVTFGGGEDLVPRAMVWTLTAGESVLDHIGWGFGVYIPTLLGFYAIVIGGQLVATPTAARRIRRVLGFVAEAMAAAFVPALLLVVIVCVGVPARAGALFVVAPVAGLMFFLAIQLGGFLVFERRQRLATAERSRDWAQQRLPGLAFRSRRPFWVVLLVHTLVASTVGVFVTVAFTRPQPFWGLFVLYAIIAAGLVLASTHALVTLRTARDRSTGVFVWVLSGGLYVAVIAIAGELFVAHPSNFAGAAGVASVVLVTGASTFWPRRCAPRLLLNWTLQGASTAYAARSVARVYRNAVREIRELTPQQVDNVPIPPIDRLRAAFRAFANP